MYVQTLKIVLKNKQTLDKIIYLLDDKKNEKGFIDLYDSLTRVRELFIKVGADPTNQEAVDSLKSAVKEARANII